MIWVVTGILVYAAILRIVNGNYEVNATIMLITSAIGVGVNIIMGCSLHQHGHAHKDPQVESGEATGGGQHGHGHDAAGKERENINVKAAFIHVIGDFVQSLGVFIAALIIYFRPDWQIVDPICTFIFSVLVLFTTLTILRNTMNVLMEGIPEGINFSVVKETIEKVPGIVAVHNLRIWGITTDKTALSAHLVIDSSRNAQDILKEASTMIRRKYNVYEMTLQVENYQQDMNDCSQCQDTQQT
jgi:cation diffusion facilitator family transporter